ncbi:LPXTG-domain-containing protein cell wall anchor domain [Alicycliphilus sp. B1]|nr:LPXTG-domain-containing protein cell wall anchor domain [Alicycliphilus sp. B1]
MSDTQPNGILLRVGALYLHHTRGKKLLRLIAQDGEELLFKEVALKWSQVPTPVLQWQREPTLELRRSRLEEVPEQIRPDFMAWSDEELTLKFESSRRGVDIDRNRAWIAKRKEDFDKVKGLVGAETMFAAYSPLTSLLVIREHVKALLRVSEPDRLMEQSIRRLLHHYAWYGMGENALLAMTHQRGHMDVLVRTYSTKTGRPNALVNLGASDRYAGRNITESDIRKFIDALQRWYVKLDYSLRKTYDLMVEFLYVQKTKTPDGQEVVWPVSTHKIPTFEAFEKRAPSLIRMLKLDVGKAGPKDGKELQERKGYDDDIVENFGDIFCIDATGFNKEGVLEIELDGETKNAGRDTAVVVRDRKSGDPRGWHLYTGAESWDEGYRLAMLCALTSKKSHLEHLGINDPDAWDDDENIEPLAVVVDNGPGVGNEARAAFERLDIRVRPTGRANPQQKGGEEAMLGRAQNAQSRDAGGLRRTTRDRDREARRKAKEFAAEDHYEIERKLVLHLIAERKARNKQHLLTIDMKKEGVQPTSKDMVSWCVQKLGGVQSRRSPEADIYLNLLRHKKNVEVLKDGITLNKSKYNSQRLRAYRQSASGKLSITVLYHPSRPDDAYWIAPTGELDILEREKRGKRLYGVMSAAEIELWHLRDRASSQLARQKELESKTRSKGLVTVEQNQQLLKMASASPPRQRTKATDDISGTRKVALGLQRDQRPYDKEEIHAPHLAQQRKVAETAAPYAQAAQGARSPAPAPAPAGPAGPPRFEAPSVDSTQLPAAPSRGRVRSADIWRARLQNGASESSGSDKQ